MSDELGVELTFTLTEIVKYLYLRAYKIKKQRLKVWVYLTVYSILRIVLVLPDVFIVS